MVIDYKITGKCNSQCLFCWDFCKGMEEMPADVIIATMEKLVGVVDTISLTGGEPLVVKDFVKIAKALHDMGFRLYLSTNGKLLETLLTPICEYIDVVGLPVDSHNAAIQSQMGRAGETLAMTLKNIECIKKCNPKVLVKVGTVATKLNGDTLQEVGEQLFASPFPADYWRVYQFTAYGRACEVVETFHISDDEFVKIKERLSNQFGDKVSFLSSIETKDSYWFITPDLKLAKLSDDVHQICGDLTKMSKEDILSVLAVDSLIIENSMKNRKHLYHDKK